MGVELQKGEAELKRVLDADLPRREEIAVSSMGEVIRSEVRDFPAAKGQRWIYDRNGDVHDREPGTHEWVLVGRAKKS